MGLGRPSFAPSTPVHQSQYGSEGNLDLFLGRGLAPPSDAALDCAKLGAKIAKDRALFFRGRFEHALRDDPVNQFDVPVHHRGQTTHEWVCHLARR